MRRTPDLVPGRVAGVRPSGGTAPAVLMLITRDQRRGPEQFAVTVSERLARMGFEMTLCSLVPGEPGAGLGVAPLGKRPFSAQTLTKLRRAIRASDVVVASGSKTLPASVIAGLLLDTPVIYQNIGDPLYWAPDVWRRRRGRALLRRTAAVAAVSEQAATALEQDFGVPSDRITVLHNARDRSHFRPASDSERARARVQLGLPAEIPVVVQVGALAVEKRVDVAIAALQHLPGIHLLVVGDGPLRAELERFATSIGRGRTTFLGSMSDVRTAYAAADAVLLTSDSEGVPGVLIEAGLCGLPAVATDVGYIRDVVKDGLTGILVAPDDADAVAAALDHVLSRSGELGSAARTWCLENFDLDRVVLGWAELIRSIAADRAGGAHVPPED